MRALALPLGLALCSLALAACDGATEPPFLAETSPTPTGEGTAAATVTATATSTPAPAAESGGFDGFRAFAVLIEGALADGDGAFFADRGVEDEMTCAGDEELGPCVDQAAGTVLRGIPGAIAQSDAFALFTPAEYATMLEEWFASSRPDLSDEYGSGELVLYALAHRPAGGGSDEAYQAIVTGIFTSGPTALRQARVLSFQFLDDRWRLSGELFATVPQTADAYLSGDCADCYDFWERWEGGP